MPQWTDVLGRSYDYEPFVATPIADLNPPLSVECTLGLVEASKAIESAPHLPTQGLASVLFRSESSASSLIEGLGPGPRRILEAEIADTHDIDDEAARRVVTNLEALRDAISTKVPVTHEDLFRWHRLLMTGHPGLKQETIGAYRTKQNWVGGDSFGPRNASYIPPSPDQVEQLMTDLLAYCGRDDIPDVMSAAIAHAQFEVIHPFADGNGRVGRLLLQHLLVRRQSIKTPIPVSNPWSRDKQKYIKGLHAYQAGALENWLLFFSASIIEAMRVIERITQATHEVLEKYRSQVRTRGKSVAARLIDDFPNHPIMDAQQVALRYGVTPQSAHEALKRLEKAGILANRSFARRRMGRPRKMYSAIELIEAFRQ